MKGLYRGTGGYTGVSMAPPKKRLDRGKLVREIARERIGTVPAARPIEPKKKRKPKHKTPPGEEEA